MKVGMLWFDDDPKRPVTEKVERAAQRYREKYGVLPNMCYANPRTLAEGQDGVSLNLQSLGTGKGAPRVTLKQARSILPNHFWLGISES